LKTFACNSNLGPAFQMMASFRAPDNIFALNGFNAEIDLLSVDSTLPDWWRFGSSQCRSTSLAAVFDFSAGPVSCLDPWEGQASGGYGYDIGYGGIDRARLRVLAAVPSGLEKTLEAGSQYYAFKMVINRSHTTGTGSCSGCLVPVAFTLEQIQLFQTSDQ